MNQLTPLLALALLLVGCASGTDEADITTEPDPSFHCTISQPEYGRCGGQIELKCDGPAAPLEGYDCVSSLTGLRPEGAMGWCCALKASGEP